MSHAMKAEVITDKKSILSYLRKDEDIQYYCIGDLDEFFFPRTRWFALTDNSEILSLGLLYYGGDIPTYLHFYKVDPQPAIDLLRYIKPELPPVFCAHLTPSLINVFGKEEIKENYGLHYKMVLKNDALPAVDNSGMRRLTTADLNVINGLYSVAYPQNWFDRRMLDTGKYFGYFTDGCLAGVAGIHVYSPETRVAALGNIAVHPDHRRRGIALNLTFMLCRDLLEEVDLIGLNVKADNLQAIRCYKKAGFGITGEYMECLVKIKVQKT